MQNELNSSSNNAVSTSPIGQNGQSIFTFPPIASFWRRFFAWLVDAIILGIVGQIIGITFSSLLFSLGPYGRVIGLLCILAYFGIMNSKICGGQTLGKRLMKIAVRNKNNEPIDLWRSIVRSLLLGSPSLFGGWTIAAFFLVLQAIIFQGWVFPTEQNNIATWLIALLVFGLGGTILYTMVFNFAPRQGTHDLLLGTHVVHLSGQSTESFPKTSRVHWVVISVWIGFITIATLPIIAPSIISKPPLASTNSPAFLILKEDPRFFSVGIHYDFQKTGNTFKITVWYKGNIDNGEGQKIANSIVKTVLDNEKSISKYDEIVVDITSAYEIGIASGHNKLLIANSVEGWRTSLSK